MLATPSRFAAATLLALAACAPAVPPPPPAVEIAPPPPPPPAASAAPVAPSAPPAPTVEVLAAPSPPACEISGRRSLDPLAQEAGLPLCLGVDGPCFAHARSSAPAFRVTAALFDGEARTTGVHLTIEDGALAVRSIAAAGQIKLRPRVLFTMGAPHREGDFVAPIESVLQIERAAAGRVTVGLQVDPAVQFPGGTVRTERRCEDLSIERGEGDLGESAVIRFVAGKRVADPPKGKVDQLAKGVDTPLATAPGQPPVATLRPQQDAEVSVLERRGRDVRVFWSRDGYGVFGWVPATAVKRTSVAGLFGLLGGLAGSGTDKLRSPIRCRQEVPILVEIGSRRVEVGHLHSGGRLSVESRQGGFAKVTLPLAVLELVKGAQWLVRESDLDRACSGG